MQLFFYEMFEQEWDEERRQWLPIAFEASPPPPARTELHGYDVATFSTGNSAECSPLSCNSLAEELEVNRHCLFATFEAARQALEGGRFDKSEPGPFRIVGVHTVRR